MGYLNLVFGVVCLVVLSGNVGDLSGVPLIGPLLHAIVFSAFSWATATLLRAIELDSILDTLLFLIFTGFAIFLVIVAVTAPYSELLVSFGLAGAAAGWFDMYPRLRALNY